MTAPLLAIQLNLLLTSHVYGIFAMVKFGNFMIMKMNFKQIVKVLIRIVYCVVIIIC